MLSWQVSVKTVVETLLPDGLKGVGVLTCGVYPFLLIISLRQTHNDVVDHMLGKGSLSRPDADNAAQLASHFIVCLSSEGPETVQYGLEV